MSKKPYIAHYHLYKNAGSSIIKALENYFGADAVIELDKDKRTKTSKSFGVPLIDPLIKECPELVCFTAHKMCADLHLRSEYQFFPIVFLRHPLLRIASVYRFEQKRKDSWERSKFAQAMGFEDWLNWIMQADKSLEARNYQTALLSVMDNGQPKRLSMKPAELFDAASVKTRLESVPVVGIVEEYDRSVEKLTAAIQEYYPEIDFNVSANQTKEAENWEEELEKIESALQQTTLENFKALNSQDYELFRTYHSILMK